MKHYLVTIGGVAGNGDFLSLCAGERELREALRDIRDRDYCDVYGEFWRNVVTPLNDIVRDKWAHIDSLPIAYRCDRSGFYTLCVKLITKTEYEQFVQMIENDDYL